MLTPSPLLLEFYSNKKYLDHPFTSQLFDYEHFILQIIFKSEGYENIKRA